MGYLERLEQGLGAVRPVRRRTLEWREDEELEALIPGAAPVRRRRRPRHAERALVAELFGEPFALFPSNRPRGSVRAMTDTQDTAPAGAPAPSSTADELAAAQARVAELEAQHQAEADAAAAAETEAAAAAEAEKSAALAPPEVPLAPELPADTPPEVRGVIAEIFDHLGALARTLEEHAAELVHLGKSASSSSSEQPAPSSSSSAPFAADNEPPAVATAGTGDLPAGG